jgi:hypothetical protein
MTPREIIKHGITLRVAYSKYARAGKVINARNKLPVPDQIKNSPEAVTAHHILTGFSDDIQKWGAANSTKYNNFIKQLLSGKLIAAGFISPRGVTDEPQLIPPDIWELGTINFSKSFIQSGSIKFESVRISKPSNKRISDTRQLNNTSRPVGRPASRNNIISAYEELKSEGVIDYSKPMTHAYPIIQERLFKKYKTKKGFRQEAIRLAIHEDFQTAADKLKSAQKL